MLGVSAIGAITILQQRASNNRSAQLRLSTMKLELASLQMAPFKANAATGGSPALAAALLQTGKGRIAETLRDLKRDNPPDALRAMQTPLEANYATLDRIYEIGVASIGYGREADRLAGVSAREQASAVALLDEAGQAYGHRAARAESRATLGAATAIALLLCAFGFLHRQNSLLLTASQKEALSDALTGLRNRRALVSDLADGTSRAGVDRPLLLALFDLDGFKQYNDTFGHPAGDALLARLGQRLQTTLGGVATAYRMGGDEFCLLATIDPGMASEILGRAVTALSESGDTFNVTCTQGSALVPTEASSPDEALRLADQRMYAQKPHRASTNREANEALLKTHSERSGALDARATNVGRLAELLAQRLGLSGDERERIKLAAELRNIGKTALPDSLLNKPGPLSREEWEFIRQQTLIGERILLSIPSLAHTATLVRSSHERIDGRGYPDGLAGDEIPIGSRIIAVCDAVDAMTSDRVHRPAIPIDDALAELRRGVGTRFDPEVVDLFQTLARETPQLAA